MYVYIYNESFKYCRGGILAYIFADNNQSLLLASLLLLLILAESKGTGLWLWNVPVFLAFAISTIFLLLSWCSFVFFFGFCLCVCICRSWLFPSFNDWVKWKKEYNGKYQYYIILHLPRSILFIFYLNMYLQSVFLYHHYWRNLLPLFSLSTILFLFPPTWPWGANNTSTC